MRYKGRILNGILRHTQHWISNNAAFLFHSSIYFHFLFGSAFESIETITIELSVPVGMMKFSGILWQGRVRRKCAVDTSSSFAAIVFALTVGGKRISVIIAHLWNFGKIFCETRRTNLTEYLFYCCSNWAPWSHRFARFMRYYIRFRYLLPRREPVLCRLRKVA